MKDVVYGALYRLLSPLVRILYANGIASKEVSLMLRRVYIDVVAADLVACGEKPTTARIAIRTGLTRKDVAALRKAPPESRSADTYDRVTRVIMGWMNDPEYHDRRGRPAVLSERGESGSLQQLIARYSGDMPAKSMLAELVRAGAVEERGYRLWELVSPVYLAKQDYQQGLRILGEDVGRLIATIEHNLHYSDDPWFQRKVKYDNVPMEHREAFRELANQENQKLLEKLNAWLAQHDRDSNFSIKGAGRVSLGVGIYYFEQEHPVQSPRS